MSGSVEQLPLFLCSTSTSTLNETIVAATYLRGAWFVHLPLKVAGDDSACSSVLPAYSRMFVHVPYQCQTLEGGISIDGAYYMFDQDFPT